jgi:hypothetical protein
VQGGRAKGGSGGCGRGGALNGEGRRGVGRQRRATGLRVGVEDAEGVTQ